jgi:ribosomal protein RSM22 (predicted rRNA methylase)
MLPADLRAVIDEALRGLPAKALAAAWAELSADYRSEVRTAGFHVSDDLLARAYLAARLPATYAASGAVFAALAERLPEFAPTQLLDVGAGSGAATLAATAQWPSLAQATLLEGSPAMARWGERLLALRPQLEAAWQHVDLRQQLPELPHYDLVVIAYVLNELAPELRSQLIDVLWLRADTLVIVEPGTPAGYARLMAVRARLLQQGATLIAPCPHTRPCPLVAPDWCHFAVRLPRSREHRLSKQAELGYEDEKYSYLALARRAAPGASARVLAPPQARRGLVQLKLCTPEGELVARTVSKREGARYQLARRLAWGELFDG